MVTLQRKTDAINRGYSGHRREDGWKEIEVEGGSLGGIKREIRDAKEPDVLV